ncbi:hypothetical protein ABIB81_009472 [Bradyrhizobium sp. I1.7.5]
MCEKCINTTTKPPDIGACHSELTTDKRWTELQF